MKLSWPLEPSYVGNASFCSSGGEKRLMGQTPIVHRALVPHHIHKKRVAAHWVAVLYAELTLVSAFVFSMLALLLLHL